MEEALLNGRKVKAKSIADLSNSEFSQLRTQFKCKDCGTNAYFNKGTLKQVPYFAAKSHSEGCNEAYYGSREHDQQFLEADTVIIPIGASTLNSEEEIVSATRKWSRSRTLVTTADGTENTSATRGVSAVLKDLLKYPEFATSSKCIAVGKQKTSASEFFVPFLQLSDTHADRIIGVWGKVFSANEGGSVVWLNRGDSRVTIQIPKVLFQELKRIYKFTSISELHGTNFLVVGMFNMHLICKVEDIKQLALQPRLSM